MGCNNCNPHPGKPLPIRQPAEREKGPDSGRVDVSEPASISSGIAARYATALFDLSKEEGALTQLEKDAEAIDAARTA